MAANLVITVGALALGLHTAKPDANPRIELVKHFTTGKETRWQTIEAFPNNSVELLTPHSHYGFAFHSQMGITHLLTSHSPVLLETASRICLSRIPSRKTRSQCFALGAEARTSSIGDLKKQSVIEVWNFEQMVKLWQAHITGDMSAYPICQTCQAARPSLPHCTAALP